MKQASRHFYLLFLATCMTAGAAVDPLESVPGFAPSLTLKESVSDRVQTTVETVPTEPGFPPEPPIITREVVISDTSTISITANITGINLAEVGPATMFDVTVGNLNVAGALADDPGYTDANKATKRNIFIPGRRNPDTGAVIGGTGVRLSWTATRLSISISRSNLDDTDPGSAAAMEFAGRPEAGRSAGIKDVIPVTVKFADFESRPRGCHIQGTTSVRRVTYGSEDAGTFEEFMLNSVSVSGSFDTSLPTAAITSPANNSSPGGTVTISGKASDGHGVAAVEYATSQEAGAVWTNITSITNLPPALPGNTVGDTPWGTTNKGWTFTLSGQPYGTNKFWVRSVDTSGNRSQPATISLVNPLPPLLTGRWDALITPAGPGRRGALTFTIDTKGSLLTGKLQLEGSAATLPFTGAWSGNRVTTTIRRTSGRPLLLTGTVNSTSPASADAALLDFDLDEQAAIPGGTPTRLGSGTAFRSPFSPTNKLPRTPTPAPALGRFNLSISAGDGTGSPSGQGYFSMLVSETGSVTVTGKMADGATVTAAPVLGAGGQLPLYVPLYDSKGSFSSLQVINMISGAVPDAVAVWNRPNDFRDRQFPGGFTLTPGTRGRRYTAPATHTRVLGLIAASPNASAVWSGDAVPDPQTQLVEVSRTNTVAAVGGANSFKATITGATGLLSGSFTLPGSRASTPWSALIVGDEAVGHYIAQPVAPSRLNRFGRIKLDGAIPDLDGADDFDDNSKDLTRWRGTDIGYGGGVLTEVNGRLEFTARSVVRECSMVRPWTRNYGPLARPFEAILDISNSLTPPGGQTGFVLPNASIGLTVYNTADTRDNLYVELYRGSDGYYFLSALSVDGDETGDDAQAGQLSPDGSVRMVYDPASRVITTYYDDDGAENGYSWTLLGSFGIGGSGGTTANGAWSLTGAPALGVAVSAFAEKTAIPSGRVHADNFLVRTLP